VVKKWSNQTEDILDDSEMDIEQIEGYAKGKLLSIFIGL
jgi:hypothetical protein